MSTQAPARNRSWLGLSVAVVGLLLLLVPLVVPTSATALTALWIISVVVCAAGVAIFVTGLGLSKDDVGKRVSGLLLLALAVVLLVVRIRLNSTNSWSELLIIGAVICFAAGLVFLYAGLSRRRASSSGSLEPRTGVSGDRMTKKDYIQLGVTIFCALLSAATSIIAAVISANAGH